MKKFATMLAMTLCLGFGTFALASCTPASEADSNDITVGVAREANSGTRSAFDELVVNSNGDSLKDVPQFAPATLVATSTGDVITRVSANINTLGYVSMGTVEENGDRIKSVAVEGVDGTVENVTNGTYELSRPFNLLYKDYDGLSDAAKNFLSFIFSEEGQEIVSENYIVTEAPDYVEEYAAYEGPKAEVYLHGSTSLQDPLMADLKEAYEALNPDVTVTFGGSGSGEAANALADGTADFGMISRAQSTSGDEAQYECIQIATDGIAVIVSKDSPLTGVTFDQLYDLYANGVAIAVADPEEDSAE